MRSWSNQPSVFAGMCSTFTYFDSVLTFVDFLDNVGSKQTEWHSLVLTSINLFQFQDESRFLNIDPQQTSRLNLEFNSVLALLLIKLNWTGEQDIFTLMRCSLWHCHELVRV